MAGYGSLQWKKLGTQIPKKEKSMPHVSLQSVFRLSRGYSERLYAKTYIRFIFLFREVLLQLGTAKVHLYRLCVLYKYL